MTTKRILLPILLILGCIILIIACFGPKNNVFVTPPQREIPLDSVKVEIDPYRLVPPVDSFLIEFSVPGNSSCPVKIELRNALHKIERSLTDSVYAAGPNRLFWSRMDQNGDSIKTLHAYYYQITICDSTYTKSFYYRRETF